MATSKPGVGTYISCYSFKQRWGVSETSPFLHLSHQNRLNPLHKRTNLCTHFCSKKSLENKKILGCQELWILSSFSPAPGACGQQIPKPKPEKAKRGAYTQENVWRQENLCATPGWEGAGSGGNFSKPAQGAWDSSEQMQPTCSQPRSRRNRKAAN